MKKGFYIPDELAGQFARLMSAWTSGRLNQSYDQTETAPVSPNNIYVGETTSIISAYDEFTEVLGTGPVNVFVAESNEDDGNLAWVDTENEITAYNRSTSTIAAGQPVFMVREPGSGQYMIILSGGGSGTPGSGNSIVTATGNMQCNNGTPQYEVKTTTAYVLISGVHFPVTFVQV